MRKEAAIKEVPVSLANSLWPYLILSQKASFPEKMIFLLDSNKNVLL
jgi:hypothetical protein